jgi:riboflavin synthase
MTAEAADETGVFSPGEPSFLPGARNWEFDSTGASILFTGLVEAKVLLLARSEEGAGQKLTFDLGRLAEGVRIGDSIAFAGCCLTVVAIRGTECDVELGSETLSRTTFGALQLGDPVNCERSLRVGDPLGGHYVTGHVDGLGRVVGLREEGPWRFIAFSAPLPCLKQMASKGSVAVDGVSLTLVETDDVRFTVALIPHTLELTTLGRLSVGSVVHVETDVLAKYVARQLEGRFPSSP